MKKKWSLAGKDSAAMASWLFRTLCLVAVCAVTFGLSSCNIFDDDDDDDDDIPGSTNPPVADDGSALIKERTYTDFYGIKHKVAARYDDRNRLVKATYKVEYDGSSVTYCTYELDYANGKAVVKYRNDEEGICQNVASFTLNADGTVRGVTGDNGTCSYTYDNGYLTRVVANVEGERSVISQHWVDGNMVRAVSEADGDKSYYAYEYGDEDNEKGFGLLADMGVLSFAIAQTPDPEVLTGFLGDILSSSGLFGKRSALLPVSCVEGDEDGVYGTTYFHFEKDSYNRVSSLGFDDEEDSYLFHYSY